MLTSKSARLGAAATVCACLVAGPAAIAHADEPAKLGDQSRIWYAIDENNTGKQYAPGVEDNITIGTRVVPCQIDFYRIDTNGKLVILQGFLENGLPYYGADTKLLSWSVDLKDGKPYAIIVPGETAYGFTCPKTFGTKKPATPPATKPPVKVKKVAKLIQSETNIAMDKRTAKKLVAAYGDGWFQKGELRTLWGKKSSLREKSATYKVTLPANATAAQWRAAINKENKKRGLGTIRTDAKVIKVTVGKRLTTAWDATDAWSKHNLKDKDPQRFIGRS